MKTVWRVFVYLKRYPMLAIATLACAIVGTLMVIVPPAATKYILNDVINGHHPERLLPLLILVAFAMLLQRGLDYLRLLLNNTFEQKVIFDLRRDLYSHIQTLPLRWFDLRMIPGRRFPDPPPRVAYCVPSAARVSFAKVSRVRA